MSGQRSGGKLQRLQFSHTCIFPSEFCSEDEDCLNKCSWMHVFSVYVEETHTLYLLTCFDCRVLKV